MSIAVVLPALDEEGALPVVLGSLQRVVPAARVVVVDNGSRDRTAEVARATGAEVVSEPRRGYGQAMRAGIRHVAARPPDALVVLDADGADDVTRLPDLLAALERADLVLTDRTAGAEAGALTPVQRFGNALATGLIRAAVGHRYRDLGPFRVIRWAALLRLGMSDETWGWNVEMQMKAITRGLRVVELPVVYRPRAAGRSKISGTIRGSARAGVRIVQAVARYWEPHSPAR